MWCIPTSRSSTSLLRYGDGDALPLRHTGQDRRLQQWRRRPGEGAHSINRPCHCLSTAITTRRFFWRPPGLSEPSGLAFGSIGRVEPKPLGVNLTLLSPPRLSNQFFTASARRSESCWLYYPLPFESVWPSIRASFIARCRKMSAAFSRVGTAPGRMSDLSKSLDRSGIWFSHKGGPADATQLRRALPTTDNRVSQKWPL
jgi:hypothetical protein